MLDWQQRQDEEEPVYKGHVDYTNPALHSYPELSLITPPPTQDYPRLRPLKKLFHNWPQDELDHPQSTIYETLHHFDFTKVEEVHVAMQYQHAKLPFKFTNVPELLAANAKWTDAYMAQQFDTKDPQQHHAPQGKCQELPTNGCAFFLPTACLFPSHGLERGNHGIAAHPQ